MSSERLGSAFLINLPICISAENVKCSAPAVTAPPCENLTNACSDRHLPSAIPKVNCYFSRDQQLQTQIVRSYCLAQCMYACQIHFIYWYYVCGYSNFFYFSSI